MLIAVHHGDGCVLLVNGNCRGVHLLNYIRSRCCLSSTIQFDLCLISSGEALNLSSIDFKLVSSERRRLPFHVQCVLTQIDDEGNYHPLLNDPTLITSEFLTKLKRATNKKDLSRIDFKQEKTLNDERVVKKRQGLKSLAMTAKLAQHQMH